MPTFSPKAESDHPAGKLESPNKSPPLLLVAATWDIIYTKALETFNYWITI